MLKQNKTRLSIGINIPNIKWILLILTFFSCLDFDVSAQVITPVPPEWRGTIDAERIGHHDANLIRTRYRSYGMVGDYPDDPINVDLSIFHSVEIPKGTGENYSDVTTPFVRSRIIQTNGNPAYIMETGYRERQGTSPYTNKTMRFEPRFGYFEPSNSINLAEAPAVSTDPRTWPAQWYDKLLDPDDPGWSGSWNGYFGTVVEKATELEVFKPDGAGIRDAGIGAAVKTAKRMQEWESLSHAVDELIKLERQVISWWDRNVRDRGDKGNVSARGHLLVVDAENRLKVTKQQISRWRKWLEDEGKYRTRLIGRAFQAAGLTPESNHGALGTGENEWYAPERYIEAARSVMGEIDLDPASSEIAQRTVKAAQYFTATQDGLRQRWGGRVWLNPPYSQPHIFNFIEKLITEATNGNVEQAIVLTHNSTDTLWFHRLEEIAASICFTKGRIGFLDEQGDSCAPTQGQAFFYCGENVNFRQSKDSLFKCCRKFMGHLIPLFICLCISKTEVCSKVYDHLPITGEEVYTACDSPCGRAIKNRSAFFIISSDRKCSYLRDEYLCR